MRQLRLSARGGIEISGCGDNEIDGVDDPGGLGDEGVLWADVGCEVAAFAPSEFLQGIADAGDLVRSPAERVHMVVELRFCRVLTDDEGLAKEEEGIVFSDGIDANTGFEKGFEKGEAVEDLVEVSGGESENVFEVGVDNPPEIATGGWATEV